MEWIPMRAIAVAVVAAAALCGQSGLPPEVVLLSRIRRAALENLDRMPNYVCMETIERSDPRGRGPDRAHPTSEPLADGYRRQRPVRVHSD